MEEMPPIIRVVNRVPATCKGCGGKFIVKFPLDLTGMAELVVNCPFCLKENRVRVNRPAEVEPRLILRDVDRPPITYLTETMPPPPFDYESA